jgi:hypothetical protein
LLAINLPALVRVTDNVDSRWLALTGVDDNGALTLTSGMGETLTLPRDVFLTRYASEAVVPWRDPAPGASVLLSGKSGALVDRFKAKLRGVGRLAANNTSDVYDAATASAVSRLQAETGLVVDGMAGKQVRMVLSSWLPEIDTPAMGTAPVTLSKPQTARVSTVEPPSAPTPEPAPAPNAAPAPEPEPPAAPVQTESPQPAPPEPVAESAPPAEDPSVLPEEAPKRESVAEGPSEEPPAASEPTSEAEEPAESDTTDMEEAPDAPPAAEVAEGEAPPTEGEPVESEDPEPANSEGELVTVSDLDEPAPTPEGEGMVEGARPTVTDPVPGSAPLVPKNY